MFVEKITAEKERKIKQWPVHSNRASEIGHPCLRYLVFLRTRWNEAVLHDADLQYIFDEGNLHEQAVLRELDAAGIKVIEQQRPFHWEKFKLTGSIDGKILTEQWMIDAAPEHVRPYLHLMKPIPTEVKSISPWGFEKISSMKDMLDSKRHYHKKYPAQLTMYELMDSVEVGLFIFKNKVTGRLKEIFIVLDLDYAETLLQKCEKINAHVATYQRLIQIDEAQAKASVPPPIPYSESICGECKFKHICAPEFRSQAMDVVDDPEAEEKMDRLHQLNPLADEWQGLDDWRKEYFKGREKVLVGKYIITGRFQDRKDGKKVWNMDVGMLP